MSRAHRRARTAARAPPRSWWLTRGVRRRSNQAVFVGFELLTVGFPGGGWVTSQPRPFGVAVAAQSQPARQAVLVNSARVQR